MDAADQDLSPWVGKRQTVVDTISPVQVRQMAATLNDAQRLQRPDSRPLPAGWHWLFFNPVVLQSGLGPDGHPMRGDFLPPVALERRMWAGSRLVWQRPFAVGTVVEKTSEILRISRKTGRTGEMVFVTVAHSYRDGDGSILEEEQDIVYRGPPSPADSAALAELGAQVRAGRHAFEREGQYLQAVVVDPVMLYRYSAATFNGHRIHYDADYCRTVEGYPGRVVHGPLIATLLLNLIETRVAPGRFVRSFEFKALRPTFDLSGFHLHAAPTPGLGDTAIPLWSTDNLGQVALDGRVTLQGSAR
ncbi:MAG: acyl-CoA dehydrogenase [Betaproteobacteria bacterium]|nr:acyl-CoA dehydrogenase [Betaproteobacteria bacterium]